MIQGNNLAAASCLFPLAQNPYLSHALGTRHRAALGLSEEVDAVILVVSEQSGLMSIAVGGRLTQGLTREELIQNLKELLTPAKSHHPRS